MNPTPPTPGSLTAFAALRRIASGPRAMVLKQLRALPQDPNTLIRVFDDATGTRLDFDLRPEAPEEPETPAVEAEAAPTTRAVGRPKLGVVAREVTLLPRHWEWLASQQGGASVALRKLVEDARRANEGRDAARTTREAAYRFMTEMAGDLPGFEEATRALFADDKARFDSLVAPWPDDVKQYLAALAAGSWKQTT
ncbi:MAG: DUF2239 family protein [Pseudomonadota bacterium]